MNKIRCFLATFALLATLSGPFVQGIVSGSVTNAATSRHASSISSSFVAAKSARSIAVRPYGPCPVPGMSDC